MNIVLECLPADSLEIFTLVGTPSIIEKLFWFKSAFKLFNCTNLNINYKRNNNINVTIIYSSYDEIIKAAKLGLIKIRKYEDLSEEMLDWIEKTIRNEYINSENELDYRYFLKEKFSFLNEWQITENDYG